MSSLKSKIRPYNDNRKENTAMNTESKKQGRPSTTQKIKELESKLDSMLGMMEKMLAQPAQPESAESKQVSKPASKPGKPENVGHNFPIDELGELEFGYILGLHWSFGAVYFKENRVHLKIASSEGKVASKILDVFEVNTPENVIDVTSYRIKGKFLQLNQETSKSLVDKMIKTGMLPEYWQETYTAE